MNLRTLLEESTIAHHYRGLKAAPRETIINKWLICTSLLYAMAAIPLSESFLLHYTQLLTNEQLGIKHQPLLLHLYQAFSNSLI